MNSLKITALVAAGAILVFTARARTVTQGDAAKSAAAISDLAWIAGDWQTAAGERAQSEEHWTRPAGGSMIGMSRTLVGDKTVSFEFLRLDQRADGIYYVASPKGRCPATDFKLTRLNGREAIFENPEHDFPQRIIYRRTAEGLSARVEGTRNGQVRGTDYPYRRCS